MRKAAVAEKAESENARAMRTILDAINRTRDANAMEDYLAEDVAYLNPATGRTDRKGMLGFHTMLFKAFPDIRYRIDRLVAREDTVVTECAVRGRQRGEFVGIPPTGKPIDLPLAFVVDFDRGKVKRWNSYFDTGTMIRQLGVAGK